MLDDDDPFGSLGLAEIQLSDKSLFDSFFATCRTRLSDYSFANTYIWRDPIHLRWRLLEDCLCVFANGDGGLTLLFPPLGPGDVVASCRQALAICDEYNARAGLHNNTRIEYVSTEMLNRMGGDLDAQPMSGDYLYETARMIDLAGGDLASKRQAKNRFARRYAARTEDLQPRHFGPCMDLLQRWQQQSDNLPEKLNHAVQFKRAKEITATAEALTHTAELGLRGMVLYAGDQLIGFTLGEVLAPDTCSIVIEKCNREFTGSANYIFSEFCRQYWSHCRWCNVGDDWELPSLAWTKQSYRPIGRLDKWIVRPKRPAKVILGPSNYAPVKATTLESLSPKPLPVESLTPTQSVAWACTGAPAPSAPARASLGDLDDLMALEQRCFAKPVAMNRRQMRYLLQAPTATIHVVRESDHVVAAALLLRRKTRGGPSARLYSIAVANSHRGRGLGRTLLNSCLDVVRQESLPSVVLEVAVDNTPAIALYESSGFVRAKRLADYYAPGKDAWKMKLALSSPAAVADSSLTR